VLASTVQSCTLQTSDYHFDPLSVVGIVPESNTFLQAIREMLGKPFEPAAKDHAVAQNAAPTLPITPTSPALTAQTQAAAAKSIGSPDLLNSIEAQLTYQASSNASRSLATASDVATETLSKAIEASKSQAFSMTNTATNLPLYSATDLVDQYIARSSAAAVASIESALVKDVVQHSPDV
jgi:SLT domain-containing protein